MNRQRLLLGFHADLTSQAKPVSAAVVRIEGVGLDALFEPIGYGQTYLPAELYTDPKPLQQPAAELAELLSHAGCQALGPINSSFRAVFAAGLTSRFPAEQLFESLPERLAEWTGLTVVNDFHHRDRAAGGNGLPVTVIANYLLHQDPFEERILIDIGKSATILWFPARGKPSQIRGYWNLAGTALSDEIVRLATRGKETADPYGSWAVQGRCMPELLAEWQRYAAIQNKLAGNNSSDNRLSDMIKIGYETVRTLGGNLHDLLCTITHWVAQEVGAATMSLLDMGRPSGVRIRLAGPGSKNGFLWQLIVKQFEGMPVERSDSGQQVGEQIECISAAILTSLTLDGTAANLPVLSGARGGRLLGRIVPGDSRNWSMVCQWLGEQAGYSFDRRAA